MASSSAPIPTVLWCVSGTVFEHSDSCDGDRTCEQERDTTTSGFASVTPLKKSLGAYWRVSLPTWASTSVPTVASICRQTERKRAASPWREWLAFFPVPTVQRHSGKTL